MRTTIDLPEDLLLRAKATAAHDSGTVLHYATPQERIRAMDVLAEKNADLPILPDSAFDRENIYEDSL